MNEGCARWINAHAPSPVCSIESCIKEHKLKGIDCVGCPDYPKEWEAMGK